MVDVCYPDGTDWSCAYTPEEIAALDPATKERSEALAWSVLSALTGYRVSTCPVTIRPCLARCGWGGTWTEAPVGMDGLSPFISGGKWYNACGCRDDCSCVSLCEVILPNGVGAVESVVLNGAVLDPTAYRIDNGNRLVRQDGECWPDCQDMSVPATEDYFEPLEGTYGTSGRYTFTREGDVVTLTVMRDATENLPGTALESRFTPLDYQTIAQNLSTRVTVQHLTGTGTFLIANQVGTPAELVMQYIATPAEPSVQGNDDTFTVTYYPGVAPNEMTRYAAGVLANEFYLACSGKECRLPEGVTSVTRAGVTMEVATGMFADGMTGIAEVDAVIRVYNPYALKSRPMVMSPDRKRRGRITTWSV
jgi:hypothetical protein